MSPFRVDEKFKHLYGNYSDWHAVFLCVNDCEDV